METKKTKAYKIQREDGNYSCGGTHPFFNGSGKTWKCIADLRAHLRLVSPVGLNAYKHCNVVELEILTVEVGSKPVSSYYRAMNEQKRIEQENKEARDRIILENAELREYERLKAKYENK